ncbi:MAG TPA: TIGR03668 family PPOX class F420-dependent oxidoreductase [Acidimicrobiales bacterium]|nr:TIGR03668 family PPOX class F420-dependent oxidoreductase [Acidimicrobiales bacterium]
METDVMRRRVAEARVGRLATVTPEGRPHVVPCCFALVPGPGAGGLDVGAGGGPGAGVTGAAGVTGGGGDTLVSAVDAKPKSTLALRRLANLRAHPAASLLVDRYDEDWSALWWVRVDGTGRVLDDGPARERALDVLAAKYAPYRERRPPGPVVAIAVTAWRAWP